MGTISKISWTHSTLNHWIGCTIFDEVCAHCYAKDLDAKRFSKTLGGATVEAPISHWGKGAPRHLTNASRDGTLLKWNKRPWACDTCGEPPPGGAFVHNGRGCIDPECDGSYERRRVFIGSLMDWADEEVPDSWRDRLFDEADQCTNLRLLFLTKRGANMHRYLTARYPRGCPDHFWIGMSYMPSKSHLHYLVNVRASVRWLSVEPMLEPCKLNGSFGDLFCKWLGPHGGINWVIFGGESGPKARPCNVDHIRDGVRQCRAGGALPFVKQLGAKPYDGSWVPGSSCRPPEVWQLRIKDRAGANMAEWPEDLRVQEVPS